MALAGLRAARDVSVSVAVNKPKNKLLEFISFTLLDVYSASVEDGVGWVEA